MLRGEVTCQGILPTFEPNPIVMLTRERVIESIRQLPETFTIDELIDRIVLLSKIEEGLRQSEKNEVISEQELDKRMQEWFK